MQVKFKFFDLLLHLYEAIIFLFSSSGAMEGGMAMNFGSETQEICNEAFGLAQRKGAAVDIRFENISYTVPQGRRKGLIHHRTRNIQNLID